MHQDSHPDQEEPDNSPHDPIQYREYKILLRPERFSSPAVYEEFWKIIRQTAKVLDVKITENEHAFCGEFAFQCRFEDQNELHKAALAKADAFYKAAQLDASSWVLLQSTKTALVYGLGQLSTTNAE